MEIDENLCRAELTPAQEAAAVARRKEIYLALYPETAAGRSQAAGMNAKLGRGDVNNKMSPTFTKATAAVSGKTKRSIERAAARGEAIEAKNLKKLVGTSLDGRWRARMFGITSAVVGVILLGISPLLQIVLAWLPD